MDYFPVFLQLKNRQTLVVGGGEIACRKVDLLLKAKANICLISPKLHPYLQGLVKNNLIIYKKKKYDIDDLNKVDFVWATTNSKSLNEQIYHEANQRNILVNVVDSQELCDFITPSIVDRTPIQIAISSGGQSPVLIRYLREKLETYLPQNLSLIADFAGRKRADIKAKFDTVDERRKFWELFFALPEVESANKVKTLELAFENLLNQEIDKKNSITFIQVGSDPELLPLKALRLMQQAEFIFCAQQVPEVFLELCRRDADRLIYQTQDELLFELNKRENKRVCLLTTDKKDITKIQTVLAEAYYQQSLQTLDAR